jgi:putative membrane protein
MILQSLVGLPLFLAYFCTAIAAVIIYLVVYTMITPHDEFALIRANVPGAAVALGLSLLGFALPVASVIAHTENLIDCMIWSLIALIVQVIVYYVVVSQSLICRSGLRPATSRRQSGSDCRRSRPARSTPRPSRIEARVGRGARAMKRSSRVSLILMAVAGIGAGAYALTPDNACRQSEPDAVPRDPPQDCRSRGHSSSGHGSALFSSSASSDNSRPGASTAPATSRGGFGWIGRALSGGG